MVPSLSFEVSEKAVINWFKNVQRMNECTGVSMHISLLSNPFLKLPCKYYYLVQYGFSLSKRSFSEAALMK